MSTPLHVSNTAFRGASSIQASRAGQIAWLDEVTGVEATGWKPHADAVTRRQRS